MPYFHVSNKIVLLFKEWQALTLFDHLLFAVLVLIVAVLQDVLTAYLRYLRSVAFSRQKNRYLIFGVCSVVYQISFMFRYALMFAVMVHSTLLFAAVVLGAGLGFLIVKPTDIFFASKPQNITGIWKKKNPEEVELIFKPSESAEKEENQIT